MDCEMSFWPRGRGDKACPKCGSELFITDSLPAGINQVLRLSCFKCHRKYLIDSGLAYGMELNLRELPRD